MHSHHSHSGQYISHGKDDLDQIVARALELNFSHYCLTEHMPRLEAQYLYPEETDKQIAVEDLARIFSEYLEHGRRLQREYRGKMQILVGFEVEGIDQSHLEWARAARRSVDMVVGSVHHVRGTPIDFSAELWSEAAKQVGGRRQLYREYFSHQREMIVTTVPEVVGHFDLIRLYEQEEVDIQNQWPEVWNQIVGNIAMVVKYGGIFECNSAAIRKGWKGSYPQKDIMEEILRQKGKICLSDDAHSLEQVGLNYGRMLEYMEGVGVEVVSYLEKSLEQKLEQSDRNVITKEIKLSDLRKDFEKRRE